MDELLQCPSCGKEFPAPLDFDGGRVVCPRCDRRFVTEALPDRPPRERTERPGRGGESPPAADEEAGLLPTGALLQAVSHGVAVLLLLCGLLLLVASLDRSGRGPFSDLEILRFVAAFGLTAGIVLAAVLNLVAACYFTLAATPVRARPLGLAQLLIAFFEGSTVVGSMRFLGPWGGGFEREMFFFGGVSVLIALEVVRLCLLGWHLRAATPPGRDSGALPLAITTPPLLLAPWLLVLLLALAGPPGGPEVAYCVTFLLVGSALGVYVWSSTVLLRLRGQLLRSARMGV